MLRGRFVLEMQRFIRRRRCRTTAGTGANRRFALRLNSFLLSIIFGAIAAALLISALEFRLRPVAQQLCAHHVNNLVARKVNDSLLVHLNQRTLSYGQLITVERDSSGSIIALSSDMARINLLRAEMADAAFDTIVGLDVHDLGIPLGSLFDSDLLWGKGPLIRVRGLVGGTVNTAVHSDFSEAGINQTLHRILLEIRIPLSVLLPGMTASTEVSTSVCVAETVIVGRVPDTYLQLDKTTGIT